MKITPLILFLILLLVLVLSIIIGKNNKYLRENFISYQEQAAPNASITIPTYSTTNSVNKIYDNLYFDGKNGNLIEIDSPLFKSSGAGNGSSSCSGNTSASKTTDNIDLTGITITSTTVTQRINNGSSNQYTGGFTGNITTQPTILESQLGNIPISYNSYIYNTLSTNTDKYSVFYIPWNQDTLVHIVDATTKTHIETMGVFSGNTNITNLNAKVSTSSQSIDNDPNNNTFVAEEYYDVTKVLYQISKNVKFNMANGDLIVKITNTPKVINVYQRNNLSTPIVINTMNGISATKSATTVNSLPFTAKIIPDTLGNSDILYIANGTSTLVAIITLASDGITYTLNNVVRFTANAIDNGSNIGSQSNLVALFNNYLTNMGINTFGYYGQFNQNQQFNPYQQFGLPPNAPQWMMNPQMTQNPSNFSTNTYSDDYILKTQIVPPVCPSCATCPNCASGSGVCTNCGGQGGSGTKSEKGATMVTGDKEKNPYDIFDEHSIFGEGTPSTGVKDASGKDIEWKSDIGKGTFSSNADPNTLAGGLVLSQYSMVAGLEEGAYTAADVAKTGINAASGAVGSVGKGIGDVAKGGVDLAKSTGSGAADLAKSAGSGAVDLAKSAGSGFMELTKQQQQQQQGYGGYGQNIGLGAAPGAMSGGYGAQTGATGVYGTPGGIGGMQYGTTGISTKGPQSMSPSTFYGPASQIPSNYMPVTADFSEFRH